MKLTRVAGVVCLILSLCLMITAVVGSSIRDSYGAMGTLLYESVSLEVAMESHAKAAEKTAPSAIKKADSARSAAESALKTAEETADALSKLYEGLRSGALGDETIDLMLSSGSRIDASLSSLSQFEDEEALKTALAEIASASGDMTVAAREMALAVFSARTDAARKAVSAAEDKLQTAYEGISDVYAASGLAHPAERAESTAPFTPASFEEALSFADALLDRARALVTLSESALEEANAAQTEATRVAKGDHMPLKNRFALLIGRNFIGVMLTGVILLAAGVVAIFFRESFLRAWRKTPVFSTFIAALVMIAIQTYSLGFRFETYGEWGSFWLSNMLNVLRSNSSVGMIALGMTFVIITGGIDLAVGSTLAGVATVVMVLLDVSPHGVLVGAGITGTPNYLIAIGAGLLTGVGIGALTGLGVTKGRIPPFIITLGVMNIVRSVAQYFTKSYKTEVPKAFQVIANKEIVNGQMLLPIIYWLALAVIMYVISRHTAFGRHIYAVGSNERTSRLSGINVNRVKMKVYMLMGLIVSIAAITSVARLRGVDVASAGNGYEMNAIAAVVVGGTSMAGGRGSIVGTVLGVLIIGIMNNLLVLLHIDAFLSQAFTGAIIIFAVLLQRKDQ